MTKFFEDYSYNDLTEKDFFLKRNKKIFLSQNQIKNESNIFSIPKEDEIEEKNGNKGKLNKCFLPRKNFILKSEICKDLVDKEDFHSNINTKKQCNALINYYYNTNIFQQNFNGDYTLINNINSNEKEVQEDNNLSSNNNTASKSDKDFCDNTNLNNNKKNIYNLNFNNNQNINSNQINSPYTNNIYNIIKTNNYYYYQNRGHMNINFTNNNTLKSQVLIIKDKTGCMMMKNKILSDPNYANEILFSQIKDDLPDLCCDNFGNYFLQTFLDIISFDNLNKFLDLITKDFTNICTSPQGTRVIQKIVEKISFTPMLINKFIYILNNDDFGLICKSQYGNHIIQKFITTFHSSEYTIFLYNYIYHNFIDVSNSKHGVFIIQKCISEGNKIQREKLYKLINDDLYTLIQNEYGNYLIQYILSNNVNIQETFQEIFPIINKIEQNLINFCMSKFSANVIEKCFENSDDIIRNHILDYLFNNYSNKIIDIFFNKYGIYALLKASKIQNGKYKNKLIDIFNNNLEYLGYIFDLNSKKFKKILKIVRNNRDLEEIYKIIQDNINKNHLEYHNNEKIDVN